MQTTGSRQLHLWRCPYPHTVRVGSLLYYIVGAVPGSLLYYIVGAVPGSLLYYIVGAVPSSLLYYIVGAVPPQNQMSR